MPNATAAGSNKVNNVEGLMRVVGNLWQNYGGAYGDYCVLIIIATIALLGILRASNWLPWLQSFLCSWLLSSAKFEWDGLALWQTGSMATHHQYLVVFCVFAAARRRLCTWNWDTSSKESADKGTSWYAIVERMLPRARSYTLLVVIITQYHGISACCLAAGMVILVVSRAYEVYYPWLVSIHSQQTCGEQIKRAMVDLQRNVLLDNSVYTDVPWPVPSFCNATHTRLVTFRAQINSYGIFMPSNLQPADYHHGRSSCIDQQFIFGWVDGSCLLTTGSLLLALFMCLGLVTAQEIPFTWRLAGGLLNLLCFSGLLLLSVPAFIFHLSKLAETLIAESYQNGLIYSQEWWSETKRFLLLLVRSGFPYQHQISVLGSRSEACFSSVMGRLEGLESAAYVLLAAFLRLFVEALLCSAVLLLKRLGLGHPLRLVCLQLRSQILTRLVSIRALFPGLINSMAIDILKAESALSYQKACLRSGLCVQPLNVRQPVELSTRLETIVRDNGAIQDPCGFFIGTRPAAADYAHTQLDDPFLARAVALGLLQHAGTCLHKMKRRRSSHRGTPFLQNLLRLVRVYAMDWYVPNVETRDATLGAARLVQEVMQEALDAHWQRYKSRDRSLEANFCECVSEEDWYIMATQVSVELLLVYMGLRISSLDWTYPQLEARVLKDWITTRNTLDVNAEVVLVH